MSVQELVDTLQKVADKTRKVVCVNSYDDEIDILEVNSEDESCVGLMIDQ